MVLINERFQVIDIAGAAIAYIVLKNYVLLDQQGMASTFDRNKLERERSKYRKRYEKKRVYYLQRRMDFMQIVEKMQL